MNGTIFTLSLAVIILAVITAVQSATLPWLWWRALKLEQKVEALDEVLAELLENAGLKPESQAPSLPPVVPPARVVR